MLNAGVSAYGIDQAFLRADLLLDECHPDVVILSFISDDINRTEFSYFSYGGWKLYFEFAKGSLILRNVSVSQKPSPRRFQTLRRALGLQFSSPIRSAIQEHTCGLQEPKDRFEKLGEEPCLQELLLVGTYLIMAIVA